MEEQPRRSSLYTRGGDSGETSLLGGVRVSKSHVRLEALGAIDELNSALGLAVALLDDEALAEVLERVQNRLFALGAQLAADQAAASGPPAGVTAGHVQQIEAMIDRYDSELPPLKVFVLPGGHPGAAQLHVARVVCRRAERAVVRLAETAPVNEQAMVYLNRLSDLMFVLARHVNHKHGIPDVPWRKD